MAKINHYCSWCNKFLFSEDRKDLKEDIVTHGMCNKCELKFLQKSLPQMEKNLKHFNDIGLDSQSQIVAKKMEKIISRIEELKTLLNEKM